MAGAGPSVRCMVRKRVRNDMVTTMDTHAVGGLNGAGEDWTGVEDPHLFLLLDLTSASRRSAFDRPGCRSKRTRIAGTSGGAMTCVEKSPVSQ